MGLLDTLTEPFMLRALLALVLAGASCAAVGTFVLLRRMAFMGGALTHTVLPGVVLAYLAGASVYLGAFGAALVTALAVSVLATRRDIHEDTAVGVVLSGMFAAGIVLMYLAGSFTDFQAILFGSLLAVGPPDLYLIGTVTVAVLGVLALFFKEMELGTLDPEYATRIGARPALMRLLLLVLTAASVVSALKLMGALLATALLITPTATAGLIARTAPERMGLGIAFAALSGLLGLVLSAAVDVPSGAAVVVVSTAGFLLTWALASLARLPRAA
jgi:manganese/iron transport system permease protein